MEEEEGKKGKSMGEEQQRLRTFSQLFVVVRICERVDTLLQFFMVSSLTLLYKHIWSIQYPAWAWHTISRCLHYCGVLLGYSTIIELLLSLINYDHNVHLSYNAASAQNALCSWVTSRLVQVHAANSCFRVFL